MAATRAPISLRRGTDRRFLGVCSGLAQAGGVDPWVVRIGFILLSFAGGVGVPLYFVLAIVLPAADAPPGAGLEIVPGVLRKPAGAALITAGSLLLLRNIGIPIPIGAVVGPSFGVGGIAAAYFSQADRSRERLRGAAVSFAREGAARLLLGAVLVAIGLAIVFATGSGFSVVRQVVVAAAITLAGIGLIVYPWVRGLLRDLGDERRERIRSEERADVAAHLHDSVLQTLALIQRNADKPRELVALARRQERELRSWLYGDREGDAEGGASLAAAITGVAEEVEDRYGVEVDVVTVGDGAVNDALLQATREAAVNAAKHSGALAVSIYVEVEADKVSVFVRDRGAGFERAEVDDDRRGITESIEGRMARHGGSATVTSTVGDGTEVALEMPR
jgi:signal transduction histidine kinase/phage shock protein PspC (stress-responsive transcriptional regulator)